MHSAKARPPLTEAADRRSPPPASTAQRATDVPILRRGVASHVFRRPGHVPLVRKLSAPPSSSNAMEPFYPLQAYVCERCFAGAVARVRQSPRRSSASTPTSRRIPTVGWSTLERYAESDDRAVRARPASSRWSKWPATTATCCNTSSRPAACRCWASSRRPTWPARPSTRAFPRGSNSSAAAPPRELADRRRSAADLLGGQQRAGARARLERLRRRAEATLLRPAAC